MRFRAVVFRSHGKPQDVVSIDEYTLPELREDEVLIEMRAAPINPADLNVLEGTYARKPSLPATPGWEGVGVIREVGSKVSHLKPGQQVKPPPEIGTWREAVIAKAAGVYPFPVALPDEQAAMISVNPPTALMLLRDFVALRPGDWIVQNAASSAVGNLVIQLARHFGYRTLNVVRRPDQIHQMKALDADAAILENVDLRKNIRELVGGSPIKLGLNAVGGESALNIANALAPGAFHVTYGAMSRVPFRVPASLLIFKDIRFVGFWLTKRNLEAGQNAVRKVLDEVSHLFAKGKLHVPVARTFPIEKVHEAIIASQERGKDGKVLLRLNA
jgi:mitochondrial enoyl-[acyl-carrier protein] reductase / trans-2-enoyl-CoA reductase